MPDSETKPVLLSREVFDFLMGEGELEGVSFGDLHEGLPGRFWWRAVLRAAEREPLPEFNTWVPANSAEPDGKKWLVWAPARAEPVIAFQSISDGRARWFTDNDGPELHWTPTLISELKGPAKKDQGHA